MIINIKLIATDTGFPRIRYGGSSKSRFACTE